VYAANASESAWWPAASATMEAACQPAPAGKILETVTCSI